MTTTIESSRLWYEQSIYNAVSMGTMAWVLHAIVFFRCAYSIDCNKEGGARKWLPLVSTIFAAATISIFCSFKFNELGWIQHRDYPGGALAFFAEQQAMPINLTASAGSIIALFLSSSFLIYRNHVLWNDRFYTILLAVQLFLYCIISVLIAVDLVRNSRPWDGITLRFAVPCGPLANFAMDFLFNSVLCRVQWLRTQPERSVPTTPGRLWIEHLKQCPVVIESVVPLALLSFIMFGVRYLADAGANHFLAMPLYVQMACVFPELIITRMVREDDLHMTLMSELTSKGTSAVTQLVLPA
ncbi:hypothetical protein SCP_0702010 [Sparassis crispa]|uniref:Uncharacterized protein n=1 Tax=Sparassis crispa TaxID=139825 RepID=A0A401GS18_9APHY|nr:hypothetical protein SCP_0702010 [Sparassis crispa]GBE85015.1 hypothetical protein SCP_0702010 [Sparassis crispa]